MYRFDYVRPQSITAAVEHARSAQDSKYLAGGMTLLPTLKLRLDAPSHLIDLAAIDGLSDIRAHAGTLTIGAMTPHAEVATSPLVGDLAPAIAQLASTIGDRQVRHRGTIGGSLANNDPAADYPAAVLAYDATVVTEQREIAADDYFLGLFETALSEHELLCAVRFPPALRAGYAKFRHPASRYAIVGVMVVQTSSAVRVAVTGAAGGVFRLTELESALGEDFRPQAAHTCTVDAADLNDDMHASAGYRAHLVPVMAARAIEAALECTTTSTTTM